MMSRAVARSFRFANNGPTPRRPVTTDQYNPELVDGRGRAGSSSLKGR